MAAYVKDPNANLDYGFNWSDWLASEETIETSIWTVPAGLTKESESNTTTVTVVWLSGGIVGVDYEVVNHIVTSMGREDDRTITLKVRNR